MQTGGGAKAQIEEMMEVIRRKNWENKKAYLIFTRLNNEDTAVQGK